MAFPINFHRGYLNDLESLSVQEWGEFFRRYQIWVGSHKACEIIA